MRRIVAGHGIAPNALAPRESLADIAATIAEIFEVRQPEIGRSFLSKVQRTERAAASDAVAMARWRYCLRRRQGYRSVTRRRCSRR